MHIRETNRLGVGTTLAVCLGIYFVYVVASCIWIISSNRRPQATLAWIFAVLVMPGIVLLVFFLLGRSRKGFSKQGNLTMEDLAGNPRSILRPVLAEQDAVIDRLEEKSTSHRRLLGLVRRNSSSTLTRRNEVDIVQGGKSFYASLVADMKTAKHSIHHQYFIWQSDEVTNELADVLCDKAKAGVEVRMLYDPIGARPSKEYQKRLTDCGVKIFATSPRYRIHTISYRNHRKISVIDGRIGYIGGMNVGKEHCEKWRDTQLRVIGDAVAVLQAVFVVDWENAVGEELLEPEYFPVMREPLPADGGSGVPVQILTSGPDSDWAAIRQLYSNMISTATKTVRLQSPYFVLDTTLSESLVSAALAGVDVKVMISAKPNGNKLPHWASRTFMEEVARAGVKIYEYDGGYMHAKTLAIDGEICSIGSANIDIRSFSINYEANAVIYDPNVTAALEADFDRDLVSSLPFDIEEYRSCGKLPRFRDSVARLFSPII